MDEQEMMRRSVQAWKEAGPGSRPFAAGKSGMRTPCRCWLFWKAHSITRCEAGQRVNPPD
jgi:hypothetical protein